jgi:hypothetical protein
MKAITNLVKKAIANPVATATVAVGGCGVAAVAAPAMILVPVLSGLGFGSAGVLGGM